MDQKGRLYESLDCLLYYQHPLFFLSFARQNCAKLSRTLIFNILLNSTNNNFKCFWSREFKQAKEDQQFSDPLTLSSGKTFLKLKQNQILNIVREGEILFQHLLCTKKGLKTLHVFVIDLLFQVIKYNSSPLVIYSSIIIFYFCCLIYAFIKDFFKCFIHMTNFFLLFLNIWPQ